MARITVEDCIDKFPSRFELVLVASNRARKLYSGDTPTVDRDNDKNTVIALREIAQQTITSEQLKNDLIEEYQTVTFSEDENLLEEENSEIEDEDIEATNNQIENEKLDNIDNLNDNQTAENNDEETAENNSVILQKEEPNKDI